MAKDDKKEKESPSAPPPKKEGKGETKSGPSDDYAAKLDMCLTDGVVKSGAGLVLGALTSALFFRRRRWPMIGGMGIGIGLAWANCEYELNPPKASQACVASK